MCVRIYLILMCCLSIWSCSGPSEKFYKFRFENASGQRVAIVMDDVDNIFPDSLVLQPGERYEWANMAQDGGFYPLRIKNNGHILVYFGDDVKVMYTDQQGRSPSNNENYVLSKIGKSLYLGVYTFTIADYEAALDSNGVVK